MAVDRVLANLDLNLLLTLDALLRERNVTRTAEQLGVSQPAVSGALSRLRRHFGDQLLVRVGNRYDLTPLATRVAALTGPALAGVRRVFDATAEFDPSGLDREFTIVSSDYAATVLGPLLARRIAAQAPGARLRLQQTTPYAVDHATDTLRTADGLFIPHGFVTGLPYLDLYTDRWVCIVSEDHPDVGDAVSMEQLAALPWVVLFDRPTAFAPAVRQLRMLGIEARVDLVVDGFLQMPFLVAGTRRVALIQERLARLLGPVAGVRALDCPFDVVPVAEAFWWNPMYRNDPAHVWLREVLLDAATELRPSA
ncbi:DNA-binding transcriptional LysR family regulator [Actinoplanes campanulatus]|uniref:DNA-binding transcriptional LysR family regulator n=1 Tax=Actinoplanes campanulatus TaxID=113559 RepID=A0A7W5AG30_9ACTN|nr:LysR family transcriptional regulator [Actinoplanes campanulatus]MBB3095415.1 DNA-binding transcriptional LysR family regulator [Actinoplanes campanulatus]GGN41968.1 LysR family transcriptional regulator [Actinoplanes campanulatus]GID35018.1 LysR family transcriptional regulator [Actinoplanes campanulatus]